MRIQITDDAGTVLYVPALNAHLERDLRELFPAHSRWHHFRRRRTHQALKEIEAAIWQLRLASASI